MAKKQKRWTYSPSKPKVPDSTKASVKAKADELVDAVLKPQNIKPPPDDMRWNYVVDIYTKWYRNYFYFCAKYASPGPNAISPHFETKFGHRLIVHYLRERSVYTFRPKRGNYRYQANDNVSAKRSSLTNE